MTTLSYGQRMAAKYADEIAALRIGDVVYTRGRPKKPTWLIEGFEPHTFRDGGRTAIIRSIATGRTDRRDVIDIARCEKSDG